VGNRSKVFQEIASLHDGKATTIKAPNLGLEPKFYPSDKPNGMLRYR
jgi:hypothetical protein